MSEKDKPDLREPSFFVPPNTLKEKVGEGGIPAEKLMDAQKYIRENKVDFGPEARHHLENIARFIDMGKNPPSSKHGEDICEKIILEVMQLKAHGGMFHYGLVSMVSDVTLQFLETLHTMDMDVATIIDAYSHAVDVILNNEMKGEGGEEGLALAWELEQACQRYHKRHKTAV